MLQNGATVTASAALPNGITNIGIQGGVFYGLGSNGGITRLGTWPTLSAGAELANIIAPADRDAGTFIGGYLASNGTQLLGGYTKQGASFPGTVAVFQVSDAGIRYVSAPGNYTAAAVNSTFLINGTGIESLSGGAAIYALRENATLPGFQFATFAGTGNSSGYTAVNSDGVLLLGYADANFENKVLAIPPSTYLGPLNSAASFSAANGVPVYSGYDVADLTTVGTSAIVLRGEYDPVTYIPFTVGVEKLALTLGGSGTQTVTVGAATRIVDAPNRCTRVLWAVGGGTSLYLGVQDKNGRRIVAVTP